MALLTLESQPNFPTKDLTDANAALYVLAGAALARMAEIDVTRDAI